MCKLYVNQYQGNLPVKGFSSGNWCVSTSPDEGFIDEDIYTAVGVTRETFYDLAKKNNGQFFYHTFNYAENDAKEVCDTYFTYYEDADSFAQSLMNVVSFNETLKDFIQEHTWEKLDQDRFRTDCLDTEYKTITAVDMDTLSKLYGETRVYFEVTMWWVNATTWELHWETMIKDSSCAELSGSFPLTVSNASIFEDSIKDFLAEPGDDTLGLVEKFLAEDTDDVSNVEKVLKLMNEKFHNQLMDFVCDELECIRKNDITADDLDTDLTDKVVNDWWKNAYASDVVEKAQDADNIDTKELAKDLIDTL